MESIQLSEGEKKALNNYLGNNYDENKTFNDTMNEIRSGLSFSGVSEERAKKYADEEAEKQTRELFKSLGIKLNSIGKNLKKKS